VEFGSCQRKKSFSLFLLRHLKVKQKKKKNLTPLSSHTNPVRVELQQGCVVFFLFLFCFFFFAAGCCCSLFCILYFYFFTHIQTSTQRATRYTNTHKHHTLLALLLLFFINNKKHQQGKEGCQKVYCACAWRVLVGQKKKKEKRKEQTKKYMQSTHTKKNK